MSEINIHSQSPSFFPENGIDLKKIVNQLYRHILIILLVALMTLLGALFYSFTIQPQYESSALLRVNSSKENVGGGLAKLAMGSDSDSSINLQQALIKTRYILEPVIVKNNLNIDIGLHYFPLFGKWLAWHYSGESVAKPFLGLKSYAWGGEKIKIKRFILPLTQIETSYKVIIGKENSYKVFSQDGKLILIGKAGELSSNQAGDFKLEFSCLKARLGTEFTLSYKLPIYFVNALSKKITLKDVMGNDPSKSTGIFQIKMVSANPDNLIDILNSTLDIIVDKSMQQNSLEIERTLHFLGNKLPAVENDLKKSEDMLNQYHSKQTTINTMLLGQSLIRELNEMERQHTKLRAQHEELLQIYTEEHPYVIGNASQISLIEKNLAELRKKVKEFPFINQEEVNLLREIKIKNMTYLSLLNKKEQLEVARGGTPAEITILSDAVPIKKVENDKLFFMFSGFFMGALLSSIVILLKGAFSDIIEDADSFEETIKIPVKCILMHSQKQKEIEKIDQLEGSELTSIKMPPVILAKQEPDDRVIESLRSLRVSLQLMGDSLSGNIISIMGSVANIGKSFVALNLAQVIADGSKKTILIDADIRQGMLHKLMHVPKNDGLSEYLEGRCDYNEVIHSIDPNLSFISCGVGTKQPIELFQSQKFKELIEKIKKDFEYVIIDMPSVLPVADSLLISQYCKIKLFVVGIGKDKLSDVKKAIKKARVHDIVINGIIMNYRKSLTPYNIKKLSFRYLYQNKQSSRDLNFQNKESIK